MKYKLIHCISYEVILSNFYKKNIKYNDIETNEEYNCNVKNG